MFFLYSNATRTNRFAQCFDAPMIAIRTAIKIAIIRQFRFDHTFCKCLAYQFSTRNVPTFALEIFFLG